MRTGMPDTRATCICLRNSPRKFIRQWAEGREQQAVWSSASRGCLLLCGLLPSMFSRLERARVEQVRLVVARDAAQQQGLVEELGEPPHDRVARLVGHVRVEARLALEELGHAVEERAAAGQDEPAVVDVGGDLGLELAERAVDDAR